MEYRIQWVLLENYQVATMQNKISLFHSYDMEVMVFPEISSWKKINQAVERKQTKKENNMHHPKYYDEQTGTVCLSYYLW